MAGGQGLLLLSKIFCVHLSLNKDDVNQGRRRYLWLVIVAMNSIYLYSFYFKCLYIYRYVINKYILIEVLVLFVELWYLNSCFALSEQRWNDMIADMKETQLKLFGNEYISFRFRKLTIYCLLLLLLGILMELTFFWKLGVISVYLQSYINAKLNKTYTIVCVNLMNTCMNVFVDQIELLRRKLSRLRGEEEIAEVRSICVSLRRSVGAFNRLFGWQLFIILVHQFFNALQDLAALEPGRDKLQAIRLIATLGSRVLEFVLILHIIIPGDAIENGGRSLQETCHEIALSKLTIPSTRYQLLILSNSMKTLAPKITAAGLIDINRRVLLGLASAVTTHYVVYLQFKE